MDSLRKPLHPHPLKDALARNQGVIKNIVNVFDPESNAVKNANAWIAGMENHIRMKILLILVYQLK
jgi:hypothetical protein